MIRLLVVVRWPLGGIRTYMKYVYRHLPRERFSVTILAHSGMEDEALSADAKENGSELILVSGEKPRSFSRAIHRTLKEGRFDLLQSHGFISAVNAYMAGKWFGLPHVLTVHGILEDRYLKGRWAFLQKRILAHVIRNVTVIYGVSRDILTYLQEAVPALERGPARQVWIMNGVHTDLYTGAGEGEGTLRGELGIAPGTSLIGFLGRFMPQKGFDVLIEAVSRMEKRGTVKHPYMVAAVGSGDYLDWYRQMVEEKGVAHRFRFLPFRQDVVSVYRSLDLVVMPSNWEACPLQPMEALCTGRPLVATNCIGLREVVEGTPARVVPPSDPDRLAAAIEAEIARPRLREFERFIPHALERFDVRQTSARFGALCQETVAGFRSGDRSVSVTSGYENQITP